MLSAETILTIATSGLFIQYLYNHFYEKSFKESYKSFKTKFDAHLREEFGKDIEKLKEKIQNEDFETISNTLKDEAYKIQEVSQPATKYLEIHSRIKIFYILIFVAIVTSIFSLRLPDYILFGNPLIDWSFYSLIAAIAFFIWIVLDNHSLKSKVIRFELGEPIQELLKEKSNKSAPSKK